MCPESILPQAQLVNGAQSPINNRFVNADSAGAPDEWSQAAARKALGLTERPQSWVGEVGDPLVFAENERRKIFAVLGDMSGIQDLIWNRTMIAVWKGPAEKKLGSGLYLARTETHRDNDSWQGNVGLVIRMGPTAFVQGADDEGKPILYPQAPKVGDWVYFTRGYGTRVKINDFECILIEKETEAIKMVLRFPHAVDIT